MELNKTSERIFLFTSSTLAAVLLFILYRSGNSLEGGMDSYNHFLIAKYGIKHPELLLDYWGKPIYNILALPFSQFGIDGLVALNILCLIGSSLCVYGIIKSFGWNYALVGFFIALLSPIFLDNTISSLTEPLNALLLSLTLLLASKEQWKSVAVLSGFLPFARSEGFVILAVFGIFFLLRKDFRAIFLLLIGPLFFNALGWIIEGEMFWVITENPYLKFELSGENVCGHGTFYHYIRWGHITFGFVVCLLLIYGFVLWFKRRNILLPSIHLVFWIFLAYFIVHSAIWGLGMMGSCGYIRVMVVIAPLAAIISTFAFQKAIEQLPSKWNFVLLTLFLVNLIYSPLRYYSYKYPLEISKEQTLYLELDQWLEKNNYKERCLAYMYPYLSVINDRDPWDRQQHEELWYTSLPYYSQGTLLIWDSHFGANEAKIPLEELKQNKAYRLLKAFVPKESFKTLNDYDFEIYVFEKLTEAEG